MTVIALNYSKSILEGFWSGLKTTLQGIMVGWVIARQTHVNQMIAQQLADETRAYGDVLSDLNASTIKSIHEEFGYDKNN